MPMTPRPLSVSLSTQPSHIVLESGGSCTPRTCPINETCNGVSGWPAAREISTVCTVVWIKPSSQCILAEMPSSKPSRACQVPGMISRARRRNLFWTRSRFHSVLAWDSSCLSMVNLPKSVLMGFARSIEPLCWRLRLKDRGMLPA